MPANTLKGKRKEREKNVKLTKVHIKELQDDFAQYSTADKKEILKSLGIGSKYFTCHLCGEPIKETDMYASTDPISKTGKSPICKNCCDKIVYQIGDNGERHLPTKESVQQVLQYLDKPFLTDLWESSMLEAANSANINSKSNVWTAYIKNVAMKNYYTLRWKDSDMFQGVKGTFAKRFVEELPDDAAIMNMFEQNKKDAIKLLGYDPFEKEPLNEQPFLYSTLVGYLDASEDANEDRMRLSSIIEIVKGFNHIEKMNNIISTLMRDIGNMEKNISTIKALEDTKTKITTSLLNLAKDNGISLKHSVNGSKGENTFTGKIKKLKEINLREAEVNGFDIGTCKGMRQVADISNASILKQINLDENDYTQMLSEQKVLINHYMKIAEEYEEKARILLRENLDLKNFIKDKGIDIESMCDNSTILSTNSEEIIDVGEVVDNG